MTAADRIKEFVAIARRIGAVAERFRIRRELKAALADCFSTQRDLNAEKVIAALDRICPEEG